MEQAEMVEALRDTSGKDVRLILENGDEVEIGIVDVNVLNENDSSQPSRLELYGTVDEDVREERGWYAVGVSVRSKKERGWWRGLTVTAEVGMREPGQPEHEKLGDLSGVEVLD